ncbi:hypothetical protein [Pontibaca salina]|uniref:Uncharacterized protein n=1 Tax=Pontibaca salina TaxID=2795731 RepID=A0A934M4A5_9RHOB|nr:hypothetical protein [Pontibaca salina]MBI6630704.1 hypothetical protein [Pontibaca salina]
MNEHVSNPQAAEKPEPVTEWESNQVHGHALTMDFVYDSFLRQTNALREKQARYLESLPTDPDAVIKAARKVMHRGGSRYPEGFEQALHLSYALDAMVRDGNVEDEGRTRDATIYLADQVASGLHRAALALDRIADILGNRERIARDDELERHFNNN